MNTIKNKLESEKSVQMIIQKNTDYLLILYLC